MPGVSIMLPQLHKQVDFTWKDLSPELCQAADTRSRTLTALALVLEHTYHDLDQILIVSESQCHQPLLGHRYSCVIA